MVGMARGPARRTRCGGGGRVAHSRGSICQVSPSRSILGCVRSLSLRAVCQFLEDILATTGSLVESEFAKTHPKAYSHAAKLLFMCGNETRLGRVARFCAHAH